MKDTCASWNKCYSLPFDPFPNFTLREENLWGYFYSKSIDSRTMNFSKEYKFSQNLEPFSFGQWQKELTESFYQIIMCFPYIG